MMGGMKWETDVPDLILSLKKSQKFQMNAKQTHPLTSILSLLKI